MCSNGSNPGSRCIWLDSPSGRWLPSTLRASLPIGERFELFGRVENLFDADYQTAAGYATAGRSAYIGARARF